MKRWILWILCLLLCLTGCGGTDQTTTAPDRTPARTVGAAQAMRSVLALDYVEYDAQSVPFSDTYGSAVVLEVTQDGGAYLVTNYHVVCPSAEGVRGELLAFPYGQEQGTGLPAQCVWYSKAYDLSLVYLPHLTQSFPAVQAIVPALSARVGTQIFALGNCQGGGLTLRGGVISREIANLPIPVTYSSEVLHLPVYRFSAAVYRGDSGGGLFLQDGSCLGLMQSRRTDTGEGYALPMDVVLPLLQKAIAAAKAQTPQQVYALDLGVTVKETALRTEYDAQAEELRVVCQTQVERVRAGSAGSLFLQAGDVLLSVEGDVTSALSRAYLWERLCLTAKEGDTLTFRYLRDGAELSYELTVSSFYLTRI